ncbi:MAG: YfhO family protein, partial [Chloroflexota bacterium]|nr:YfhO family protein [Chloroflexota bacterium]
VESITGAPVAPGWSRYLGSRRGYERAVEVNLAGTDPGGAGEFLQQQVAVTGPFRYVGYGLQLSSDGRPTSPSYPDRRFGTYAQAILVNARAMPLGLYDIQGYNPQQLRRYTEFVAALNGRGQNYHFADLLPTGVTSPLLNLLNVRYVLLDASLPPDRPDVVALTAGKREVFWTKHVIVYENPAALPHAWIVHDVRSVATGEVLPLLTGGTIDPRRTALIEGPAPPVAEPGDRSQETASVMRYEPEQITLATTTTAPGLLVLREVYANGWRAYVDGERVDVLPTDHALRGVPIPAGEHSVGLRYEPPALRLGLLLSGVSTVAMLAVFVASAWSRLCGRVPALLPAIRRAGA